MKNKMKIERCRLCNSEDLTFILSLGDQYVTNFIESQEEQKNIPKVPLNLVLCEECKLLQLEHNAPPESMWSDQYWYKSGISTTIKNDLQDIVEKSLKLIELEKDDTVIDIGCNDGTLLSFYPEGLNLVGFEPSGNVAGDARKKGFNVINNFFSAKPFKEKFGDKKAKLITAISMFYDLENPNRFLEDIISVLDKGGMLVIQQNYLLTMLENNAFDNICHEHREYYSLISFNNLLERHGLEVFDIEQNEINGGSIRTYIRFKDNEDLKGTEGAKERIDKTLEKERTAGLDTLKPYKDFAGRISKIKEKILSFIKEKKSEGKSIWIYGAGTRGNVILQYLGLNANLIDSIADKNPDKEGKKTVGTLIPITSPENMREVNPDYLLVNVWHFFDEIVRQEKDWFERGGTFLTVLPEFRVVEN